MCGVIFAKGKDIVQIYEAQAERGFDGIGICPEDCSTNIFYIPDNNIKTGVIYSQEVKKNEYIKNLNNLIDKKDASEKMLLLHHRKASIGDKSIDNVHPFKGERFIIAQNGTDKSIRFWGTLSFIPEHYSDTYCLLKYLEHTCNKIELVTEMLNFLVDNKVCIGTIWIVDYERQIGLIYSDGTRPLYIDETDGNITFSSLLHNDEYTTIGYALFKLNGTIIENHWETKNVKKVHTHYFPYTPVDYNQKYQTTIWTNPEIYNFLKACKKGEKVIIEFTTGIVKKGLPLNNTAKATIVNNTLVSNDSTFVTNLGSSVIDIMPSNFSTIKSVKKDKDKNKAEKKNEQERLQEEWNNYYSNLYNIT